MTATNQAAHSSPSPASGQKAAEVPPKTPRDAMFQQYLRVGNALAMDSFEQVRPAAQALQALVEADTQKTLPNQFASQTKALAASRDLASARTAFKSVSESLIRALRTPQNTAPVYRIVYCPMADASWLQVGNTILNPYMGKSMVHCGTFKS